MSNFYIVKRTSGDYVGIDLDSTTHFEQKPALNRANERWKPSDGNPASSEAVLVYVGDYVEEIDLTFVEFVRGLSVSLGVDPYDAQKVAEKLEQG